MGGPDLYRTERIVETDFGQSEKTMEKMKYSLKWLAKNWVVLVSGLALGGACTITFVNVIVRYFFTSFVIIGGEELTTLFICWTVFVGAAQAYKEKLLFGIDIFLNLMKPGMRNIAGTVIDVIVLIASGYICYLGWQLAHSAWIRTTSNLGIPYFFVDVPICIGFGMICYYDFKDLVSRIVHMCRKNGRSTEKEVSV